MNCAEIEACLESHPAVRQAVVLVAEDQGQARLTAYLVADPDWQAQQCGPAERKANLLDKWQAVFEEAYSRGEEDDAPSFVGWDSSYTGRPLPEGEMKAWLDGAVRRISALRPRHVLEIGCGVGLILDRVAPFTQRYVGTDVSRRAIARLRRHVAGKYPLGHVTLVEAAANALPLPQTPSFDVIILNSVVQYFPDVHYLIEVLCGAAKLLHEGGSIFVGDVRHFGLLELFQLSVALRRAHSEITVGQFKNRLAGALAREKELAISPEFFANLAALLPRLAKVEILLKDDSNDNELTHYRYDVVLRMDAAAEVVPDKVIAWRGAETLDEVEQALKQQACFLVTDMPNERLRRDLAAARGIRSSPDEMRLNDALTRCAGGEWAACDPATLARRARDHGLEIQLSWSSDRGDGSFDALIFDPARCRTRAVALAPPEPFETLLAAANTPAGGDQPRDRAAELRTFLAGTFPECPVPAAFSFVESLPLDAQGQVDRERLASAEEARALDRRKLRQTLLRASRA